MKTIDHTGIIVGMGEMLGVITWIHSIKVVIFLFGAHNVGGCIYRAPERPP